jgi:diamine N-acetyltransferase
MLLSNNKVLLRAINDNDINDLYRLRFDDESYNYFYEFPITSVDGYKKWLQSISNRSDQINFAIEDRVKNQTIGTISLVNIDNRNRKAEMGRVLLDVDFRGNGYFKEIATILLGYAFNDLNLRKIYCEVFSDNKSAVKAYTKNGFLEEGVLRKHIYKNGQYKDIMILSIFRNDDKG